MKFVRLGRQCGKTTLLVEWLKNEEASLDNKRVLVVLDHKTKKRLLERYPDLPKDRVEVVETVLSPDYQAVNKNTRFAIDNADSLFYRMWRQQFGKLDVGVMSMTASNWEELFNLNQSEGKSDEH